MSFNITPQSSSAFQNDILNQIIAALNSLDTSGITDSDFLNQAQSVLFAGTFLPSGTNTMQMLPLNTANTTWLFGGGLSAPLITLQTSTVATNSSTTTGTGSFGTVTAGTVNGTGSASFASATVNGSPVITQATLPSIPPATPSAFTLFNASGNFSGTIGIVQFGFTLTMDININVTTAFTGWTSLIPQTNTAISALCNRLRAGGMQTAATILDQWIAGNNQNNDVRAICEMSSANGLRIQGVTGGLNVGDQFNVMITWAVDSFA